MCERQTAGWAVPGSRARLRAPAGRPTCVWARGLPARGLRRVHGPVQLPAEVLAVVHVDVVVHVLVHHVRLKRCGRVSARPWLHAAARASRRAMPRPPAERSPEWREPTEGLGLGSPPSKTRLPARPPGGALEGRQEAQRPGVTWAETPSF